MLAMPGQVGRLPPSAAWGISAATNRLQFEISAPDMNVSLALRSGLNH